MRPPTTWSCPLSLHDALPICFARESRVANGIGSGVAARRVGQQENPLGVEEVQHARFLRAVEIHAAHRDRHDFGPRGLDRVHHGVHVAVLAGSDQQARLERAPADRQWLIAKGFDCGGHPPPTKCTTSIASPLATVTSLRAGRRTMVRLCSTTTARGSSSSSASTSSSVPPRISLCSPLITTSTLASSVQPRQARHRPITPESPPRHTLRCSALPARGPP